LSYKKEPPVKIEKDGITWLSESIYPWGPVKYIAKASTIVRTVKPDWIVGFSDTYYGILAEQLGTKYGLKSVIDAYDNYESYIPWFKLLHHYWRKAIAHATVVTAAGPHLGDYLNAFRPNKEVRIVPMAADPEFVPLNKRECRQKLGLPLDKQLVGYCGAIYNNRGIDLLFKVFTLLKDNSNIAFVLSGRKEKNISLPNQVKWLGYLPDEQVPLLLNSLDVLLVINKPSAFGHFSYPVKLYEAMRCHIPVVVADVEGSKWILKAHPQFLARTGDAIDFAEKIQLVLALDKFDYGSRNSWEHSGEIFERVLFS
jgi:glycosyltransferase involved in cell wall biosynthesis